MANDEKFTATSIDDSDDEIIVDDSNDDLFAANHAPDPVAVRAQNYAVEVTNPDERHPWLSRIVILLAIFLVVAGTFGAVVGTINTIELRHQNSELRTQQVCQAQLLKSLTLEQQARTDISADDRNAVSTLIASVSRARSEKAVQAAFKTYNAEAKENDIKRAKYPIPTFNDNVCLTTTQKEAIEHSESSPVPMNSTTTPKPGKTSGSTTNAKSTPHASSTPGGGVGPKVTKTVVVPRATVTATRTKTKTSTPTSITTPPNTNPLNPIVGPVTSTVCVITKIICL